MRRPCSAARKGTPSRERSPPIPGAAERPDERAAALTAYLVSLGVGLAVGIAHGLLGVRSPAPPIIALLGLLGMLAGEAIVSYLRGHADVLASACHAKSFAIAHEETRTLASAARAAPRQPEEVG